MCGLKPRVRGDVSGSEEVIFHRVAQVVASGQINVFAMEFMVEISCLRKSATSSFCKVLLHRRDVRGFGNRLESSLLLRVHHFKKCKKVSFFLILTALGRGWDLVFAGSFCRLLLYESAIAFSCFINNKFHGSLYKLLLVTPTLACSKTCDFT